MLYGRSGVNGSCLARYWLKYFSEIGQIELVSIGIVVEVNCFKTTSNMLCVHIEVFFLKIFNVSIVLTNNLKQGFNLAKV